MTMSDTPTREPMEPLPCPFCGEAPIWKIKAIWGRDGWGCKGDCPALGIAVGFDVWNHRALPPARPADPTAKEHVLATEMCMRCDGCGWYEGGKTLQTKCEVCGGTGEVPRRVPAKEAASETSENIARNYVPERESLPCGGEVDMLTFRDRVALVEAGRAMRDAPATTPVRAASWEAVGWRLVDAAGVPYHLAPATAEEAVRWSDDLNVAKASASDPRYTLPFVIRDLYEHPSCVNRYVFDDYSHGDLTAFVSRYAPRLKWAEADKLATALADRFASTHDETPNDNQR